MPTPELVSDGIFRVEDGRPILLGSRCITCSNHMFPRQSGCPRCLSIEQADIDLATRGRLWAWTVQAFPPKSPPYLGRIGDDFVPFGVGYVELAGQLRVESRLTVADPKLLRSGMEMELVLDSLVASTDGTEILTFAFSPVEHHFNGREMIDD